MTSKFIIALFIFLPITAFAKYDEQWITPPVPVAGETIVDVLAMSTSTTETRVALLTDKSNVYFYDGGRRISASWPGTTNTVYKRGDLQKLVSADNKFLALPMGKMIGVYRVGGLRTSGEPNFQVYGPNPVDRLEWSSFDGDIALVRSTTGNDFILHKTEQPNTGSGVQLDFETFQIAPVDRYISFPNGFAFFAKGDPQLNLNIVECSTVCKQRQIAIPSSFKNIAGFTYSGGTGGSSMFPENPAFVIASDNGAVAVIDVATSRLVSSFSACGGFCNGFLGFRMDSGIGASKSPVSTSSVFYDRNLGIIGIFNGSGKIIDTVKPTSIPNLKDKFVNTAGVFFGTYPDYSFADFKTSTIRNFAPATSYVPMHAGSAWIIEPKVGSGPNNGVDILALNSSDVSGASYSAKGRAWGEAYGILGTAYRRADVMVFGWWDQNISAVIADSAYNGVTGKYGIQFFPVPDANPALAAFDVTNDGVYFVTPSSRLKFVR